MSTFRTRITVTVRKYKKRLLAFIGVGAFVDLFKEYGRSKAMDWMANSFMRLGDFGIWAATYQFAFVTIGLVCAFVWLIWATIRESETANKLKILDPSGKPFVLVTLPKSWSRAFTAACMILIGFLSYGAYVYYTRVPLLRQYPLGYVIYDDDYITSAISSLEAHRGIEGYTFDIRPAGIKSLDNDRIAIQLPDLIKNNQRLLTNGFTSGPKRVGNLGCINAMDDKKMILGCADILEIEGSKITFLIGFSELRFTQHPGP
jgi:hypothetical protein